MMADENDEKKPMTVQELAAMGGRARAEMLSKKRRSEIAKQAAAKRWGAKKAAKKAG